MTDTLTNGTIWENKMRKVTTQELIDRLTRERDEALAKLAAHEAMEPRYLNGLLEARAKAIDEAAAVVVAWKGKSYMVAFSEIRREMAEAILALKENTVPADA